MRKLLIYFILGLSIWSCENLDVDNPNDPDRKRVLSNPEDVKNLALQIYQLYWQTTHDMNLYSASLIAADQFTASWKNYGWMDAGMEPRVQFNNQASWDNAEISLDLYNGLTSALSSYLNPILDLINKGMKLGVNGKDNASVMALCYFLQGVSLGQLGIVYDKSMITKETTNLDNIEFSNYENVIKAAVESLEKSISICDTSVFTLDAKVVNGTKINNSYLKRVCHSYIARFLAMAPRTTDENDSVDWEKVLSNSLEGITEDFGPLGDATYLQSGRWYDNNFYNLTNPLNKVYLYGFVDSRIIHLMDTSYTSHYPADGNPKQIHPGLRLGEAESVDNRLKSDFRYYPSCEMYPDRGYYFFSNYQYIRYDYMTKDGIGQLFDIRQYENELLKAEAYVMKNSPENNMAASILIDINNPMSARGGLTSANSDLFFKLSNKPDKATILKAIFYEREIELLGQGFMVGFCDMRRQGLLQRGTPFHFPIPGKELETLGLDYYTFGGQAGADGKDASDGGWELIKNY